MAFYKSLKSWGSYCVHITALPVFFLCFVLLYDPSIMGGKSFSVYFSDHYALTLMVLTLILPATIAVIRMIYTFICRAKSVRMDWFTYALWCVMEVVVASQFMALYTSLVYDIHYLPASTACLKLAATVLMFPYIIIALALYSHELAEMKNRAAIEEEVLVRFHDENKKLKLVIAPSAILYLQSDENYVNIIYLESDKVKTFVLRASMKSLESIVEKHRLVRCHRSYVVNPSHVSILKKETDGSIIAELDDKRVQPIPVSKRYYDSLSELL